MSRIAGILSVSADAPLEIWLGPMIAAQCGAGWTTTTARSGAAAFAWSGWRAANVADGGGVIATLDGSVYNRCEWPKQSCDAALLADLYRRHGFAGAISRLNGDFAAALYDARAGTLWLARDRFGVKPLYYARAGDALAFASRPKGVLQLPGVTGAVNRQFVALFAASHYRYFDNDRDRSPYVDVMQLPAGHVLEATPAGVRVSPFWRLEALPDFEADERALADEYRALLLDSVRLRLTAADRPAFTLSGGMDSSSVLAAAVASAGATQDAFSVVYDDKVYDESAEIQTMLDATVREWHPIAIGTPDVASTVDRMIAVHDEPVATATWLSHYLLCGEVKGAGFGSLFGGLGGDELNAGEYEYFFYFFADLARAGRDGDLKRETRKWIEYHDHPIFRKNFDVMRDGLARLVDLARPGVNKPDRRRMLRYRAALNRDYFDLEAFQPMLDRPFPGYLKNRTYQDLFRETAPCCLRAEDRQSTAAGLDHFLPFLDYRLVEFMFRVSGTLKFRDGITKHLLRQAMTSLLPEETRTRIKKTGWNAPAHVWFIGRGADLLRDVATSQRFRERGIYDAAAVVRLIDEHEAIVAGGGPVENHMMFLWQLLNLELWLRQVEAGVA